MPSGYTAALYDGKDQSFSEFVLTCARAFAIGLRDTDMSVVPTEENAVDSTDYNEQSLNRSQERLSDLLAMSGVQIEAEARRDWQRAVNSNARTREEALVRKGRYEAMLDDVNAWVPPTPDHQGLKDFMVEQLTSSIKFDCHFPADPPLILPTEWHAREVAQAERSVAYDRERIAAKAERNQHNRQWVRALRSSLEVPA